MNVGVSQVGDEVRLLAGPGGCDDAGAAGGGELHGPAAVTEALAHPDPWQGFTGYIHAICAMQAADRGFADVLTMTSPAAAKALEARRAEAYHGLVELIARA
ncbi:hypothetical protein [Yinghuangia sp. YIM S10712]|uniref:hypothetical protein n=1 Tax=Yinghuangia sp. YIM S10712 TaxID=3436930 RepID=UPI003F52BF29